MQSDRRRNGRSYFFRRPCRTRTTVTPAIIAKLATAFVIVTWRSTRIRHPLPYESRSKPSFPYEAAWPHGRDDDATNPGRITARLILSFYQILSSLADAKRKSRFYDAETARDCHNSSLFPNEDQNGG